MREGGDDDDGGSFIHVDSEVNKMKSYLILSHPLSVPKPPSSAGPPWRTIGAAPQPSYIRLQSSFMSTKKHRIYYIQALGSKGMASE